MINADVKKRQEEVRADLIQYLEDRKAAIDNVWKEVQAHGPTTAASGQVLIANARHATVAESEFLEQTHNADDKAPINFLELGMRAAKAVCHVVDENRQSLGTGFLVGPGLLLTNNHVLPDADAAGMASAVFGFELNADEDPLTPATFRLKPERGFVTSPRKHLDSHLSRSRRRGTAENPLRPRAGCRWTNGRTKFSTVIPSLSFSIRAAR